MASAARHGGRVIYREKASEQNTTDIGQGQSEKNHSLNGDRVIQLNYRS